LQPPIIIDSLTRKFPVTLTLCKT